MQCDHAGFSDGEAAAERDDAENADGTAQSLTSAAAIAQALDGVQAEQWAELVSNVRQPVLLLNSTGEYGPPGSPPVVPAEQAIATSSAFADCKYVEIPGNHLTMVFGESAALVRHEMEAFIDRDRNSDTGR